jgi:hypothetical protein
MNMEKISSIMATSRCRRIVKTGAMSSFIDSLLATCCQGQHGESVSIPPVPRLRTSLLDHSRTSLPLSIKNGAKVIPLKSSRKILNRTSLEKNHKELECVVAQFFRT